MRTVQTDGYVYTIKDNDGHTYGTYLTKVEVEARLSIVREEHKDYFDEDVNVEDEIYYHMIPLGDKGE